MSVTLASRGRLAAMLPVAWRFIALLYISRAPLFISGAAKVGDGLVMRRAEAEDEDVAIRKLRRLADEGTQRGKVQWKIRERSVMRRVSCCDGIIRGWSECASFC